MHFEFRNGMDVVAEPTIGLTGGGNGSTVEMSTISGEAFSLRSMNLRSTQTVPQEVTFTGTTINGQTVTRTVTIGADDGLTVLDGTVLAAFGAVTSVTWDSDGVVFDDIVVRVVFDGTPEASVGPVAIYTISSSITFDTNGVIETGTITVDSDGDGEVDATLTGETSLSEFATYGISSYLIQDDKVREIRFAGDLRFDGEITVRATSSLGLSLYALNDVSIGSDVKFDFSGSGTEAGSGGSSGVTGGGGGVGGFYGRPGEGGSGGRRGSSGRTGW